MVCLDHSRILNVLKCIVSWTVCLQYPENWPVFAILTSWFIAVFFKSKHKLFCIVDKKYVGEKTAITSISYFFSLPSFSMSFSSSIDLTSKVNI